MYSYIYDEEAVIQEADIELAEMTMRGNYLARLKRMGICTHESVVGVSDSGKIFYPEQVGLTGEQVKCWGCGIVFESPRDWVEAMAAL